MMNPLCPRCHATLQGVFTGDELRCPSCEYTWDGTPDLTLTGEDSEPDDGPVYIG